jgi:hypothetical protein
MLRGERTEEATVYEKQRQAAVNQQSQLQLRDAKTPASKTDLRGMSYAAGQAHLAPAVQLQAADKESGGDKEKLLALVSVYVEGTFGGDMQKAFARYAKGGVVDQDGVTKMLVDAGVKAAFGFLKWLAIPGAVMSHFDTSGDGKITAAEFDVGLAL